MSKLDKIPEAVRDLKTDGEAAFMQALLEIEPDEDIMSCEYCEYYRVKADRFGRKCRIDYCPCLKERIPYGAAGYIDFLIDLCHECSEMCFVKRALRTIDRKTYSVSQFLNRFHRPAFEAVRKEFDTKNPTLMATLYLLTAKENLWNQVRPHAQKNKVNFSKISLSDCSASEYTLFCVAKDMYEGTSHYSLDDLADPAIASAKLFSIICNAFVIRKFGVGAIYI